MDPELDEIRRHLDPYEAKKIDRLQAEAPGRKADLDTLANLREILHGLSISKRDDIRVAFHIWSDARAALPRCADFAERMNDHVRSEPPSIGLCSRPVTHFVTLDFWPREPANMARAVENEAWLFLTESAHEEGVIGDGAELTLDTAHRLEIRVRATTSQPVPVPPNPPVDEPTYPDEVAGIKFHSPTQISYLGSPLAEGTAAPVQFLRAFLKKQAGRESAVLGKIVLRMSGSSAENVNSSIRKVNELLEKVGYPDRLSQDADPIDGLVYVKRKTAADKTTKVTKAKVSKNHR